MISIKHILNNTAIRYACKSISLMNAIVQVFSKHAKDTDLCAMLNMVNALISNEVTNMGRKQMSEYTSKFTKPYFYFYPGD